MESSLQGFSQCGPETDCFTEDKHCCAYRLPGSTKGLWKWKLGHPGAQESALLTPSMENSYAAALGVLSVHLLGIFTHSLCRLEKGVCGWVGVVTSELNENFWVKPDAPSKGFLALCLGAP